MANYFVINRPSNLIIGVASTSYTPKDSKLKRFILANDRALDIYYGHMAKDPDTLLDIGEVMAKSPHVYDQVAKGRVSAAKSKSQRIRAEQVPKPVPDREREVEAWIASHPTADAYDLDAALYTGIVAARAYLLKYT